MVKAKITLEQLKRWVAVLESPVPARGDTMIFDIRTLMEEDGNWESLQIIVPIDKKAEDVQAGKYQCAQCNLWLTRYHIREDGTILCPQCMQKRKNPDKARAEIHREVMEGISDAITNLLKTFNAFSDSLSQPHEEIGLRNMVDIVGSMDKILSMIEQLAKKLSKKG